MALPLEDYGLIGDTQTAALVGRDGSIDWLCLPRFDAGACFAALLGDRSHGRWLIGPEGGGRAVSRRYLDRSLVLAQEFETSSGRMRVIDFMPPRDREPDLVRIVEGVSGRVNVEMELVIRFDYGSIVPWVRRVNNSLLAIAGPDALSLWSPVPTSGHDLTTRATFEVAAGERRAFVLAWHPSHESLEKPIDDPVRALADALAWWGGWTARCTYDGPWRDQVLRSLITLKALTYAPTGGIVAAPTTSLPERLGGVRNWDYRYCWLRDATFTLMALSVNGYVDEAAQWRNWLLRAAAGDPADLQILYGPAGERRLLEIELPWLPGYEGAKPVRIGNAASKQLQLDVYGEMMDVLDVARRAGLPPDPDAWSLQKTLLRHLAGAWKKPDEGIWEVRGPRRHFTHSKVMAWVAFDRAVRAVEQAGLDGPVERWRTIRAAIHEEVCANGFDPKGATFVQYYGADIVDASLLMIPLVGFLPAADSRVAGTVAAVERQLLRDGLVQRYRHDDRQRGVDGLPPGEGAFLPCSFWLADNYVLAGRRDEAVGLFERLVALSNDLGLLSEEYEPDARRLVGNFPQAFSHVALVNTARNLARPHGPAERRREGHGSPLA
jgi:GH15 family glucan-1,4-alpha-glucosidase